MSKRRAGATIEAATSVRVTRRSVAAGLEKSSDDAEDKQQLLTKSRPTKRKASIGVGSKRQQQQQQQQQQPIVIVVDGDEIDDDLPKLQSQQQQQNIRQSTRKAKQNAPIDESTRSAVTSMGFEVEADECSADIDVGTTTDTAAVGSTIAETLINQFATIDNDRQSESNVKNMMVIAQSDGAVDGDMQDEELLDPVGCDVDDDEDDRRQQSTVGSSLNTMSKTSYHDRASMRPKIHETSIDGRLSRHITVDAPTLPPEKPYIENPLPGVADEVESYPCRHCPDRVFLTSFGLERHTKMAHPEHLDVVLQEITRIQDEWRRRETERGKQRERIALAKIRQESLAAVAAREAINNTRVDNNNQIDYRNATNNTSGGQHEYSATIAGVGTTGDMYESDGGGGEFASGGGYGGQHAFESCRICGLLINAEHPTAMENHMRAHKKNDELRAHLLAEYGPQFVARVTCHECQLVFTDERKLIAHAETMHVRRRKYVCKWCGQVCMTMTDLNSHKADVHGMPVSRSRDPEIRRQRQVAALTKGHGLPPPLGMQSAATRRAVALAEASRQQGVSPRVLTSVEELPCRTTCDFCGLIMVKPSLLIRHMMRVHNRTNFTATVETKGMPPFKVNYDKGKLSWTCCSETYSDRSSFVYHRRSSHTPKFFSHPGGAIARFADENPTTDGTSTDDGHQQQQQQQQYLLVVVNSDDESAEKVSTNDVHPDGQQQQIMLTPEQLLQLGLGDGVDGESVVLLVDDGSGTGTQQLVQLQQSTDGDEQQLVIVQGDGETTQLLLDPTELQQLLQSQGVMQ